MSDTDLLLIVPEHQNKPLVVKYRNVSAFIKTISSWISQTEQDIKNNVEGINRLLHLLDEGVHVVSEKRLYT